MLSPREDLIQDMLQSLDASHQSVTAAAIALQQTILFAPDPTPDWFDPLQTSLIAARASAARWLTDAGPQIIAGLPQELVAYAGRVEAVADNMPKAQSVEEARGHLAWLKRFAKATPAQAAARQQSLVDFANDFRGRQAAVETAIAAANASLQAEEAQAQDLRDRIAKLQEKTSGLTTKALDSQKRVEYLEEIGDLQVQLSAETERIAALQGIISALQSTGLAIAGVNTSVEVKAVWDDVNSGLDDVLAGLAQPGVDFRQLKAIRTLPDAAKAWHRVAQLATNTQRSASGLPPVRTANLRLVHTGVAE